MTELRIASEQDGMAFLRHLARAIGRDAVLGVFEAADDQEGLVKCRPAELLEPLFDERLSLSAFPYEAYSALLDAMFLLAASIVQPQDTRWHPNRAMATLMSCLFLRNSIHRNPLISHQRVGLAVFVTSLSGSSVEEMELGLRFARWLEDNDECRDFRVHYALAKFTICAMMMNAMGPGIIPRYKEEAKFFREEWILGKPGRELPLWSMLWRDMVGAKKNDLSRLISEVESGLGPVADRDESGKKGHC